MEHAIGDLLPSAVGVALSPVPIVAVILMLGTPRARTDGPAFAAGWILGLSVVSAIALFVSGGADEPESGASTATDVVQLVLGVAFLGLAAKEWRGRPRAGDTPEMPKWMATIDQVEPGRAFVLGVLLSAVNPKNLALTLAAAASLGQAGLTVTDDVIAIIVFVLLASSSVLGAVLLYFVGGERSDKPLASMKDFMIQHSVAIMLVILLVLGAKLVGAGLGGLTD
jgi:threonine/homoserine/homoserine lactone efflux protein